MISQSPRPPTKVEQLGKFLDAPTPPSFLEPSPARSCERYRVGAQRQDDGSYKLYTLSPAESHKPSGKNHLPEFLDEMLSEMKGGNGQAVHNMRRVIGEWKPDGYLPLVQELREANAALHAEFNVAKRHVSDFQIRNRARHSCDQLEVALQQALEKLSPNDPRRADLAKAGDQLVSMLFQPDVTLSLKGISPVTLALLINTGLLHRFADLRDGVDPAPDQLILPADAHHLHDQLPEYLAVCPLVLC